MTRTAQTFTAGQTVRITRGLGTGHVTTIYKVWPSEVGGATMYQLNSGTHRLVKATSLKAA